MVQGLVMCIMMTVIAIVASMIHRFVIAKRTQGKENIQFVRSVFFFFFCFYFLISLMKWYLGSPDNTLIESFWDAEFRTYIHYGIPLFIAGIIIPIVGDKILKDKSIALMGIFDSVMLPGLMVAYISCGVINNVIFSLVFIVAGLLSLVVIFLYKHDIVYLQKTEYKKTALGLLPAVGTLFFMMGVYYPNELYLNNLDEFLNPFGQFFAILLIGSILGSIIVIACVLLLPKTWICLCNYVIAGIVVMEYLQAMFLNGDLKALTGDEQTWSPKIQIVNGIIWLAVIVAMCVLGYYKNIISKVCKGICVYICLIQAVTLGYMIVTTDVSQSGQSEALTTQNSLELATDDNVLVFVLDMFDSSVFQQILEEDADFVEPLSDFTYYRNATSAFGHTKISLPYLLTGTQWKEGLNPEQYRAYAYANSNALADIAQQDCNVGVYTKVNYLDSSVYDVVSNYSESVSRNCNISNTYSTMFKTSMYKLLSFTLKSHFSYYTRDIVEMVDSGDIWTIENDLPFYNKLTGTGLSVNEEYKKAFRFYHMVGDHEPFYLSEDLKYDRTGRENSAYGQAKGCLKIVYEYLRQLKELGKYDDATIIITADHGKIATYEEEVEHPAVASVPIMLVKRAGQSQAALSISDAPVSHTELMPEIMKALGNDNWSAYGNTFEEIDEDVDRVRYFVDMLESVYMIQFAIDGDANDTDNWIMKQMIWESRHDD